MSQPRVSGRLGDTIDLNNTFYRNGVPTDPYAIRKVEIYKSSVQEENLVAEFPVLDPVDVDYPLPLEREQDSQGTAKPGVFHLLWDIPKTGVQAPETYFDLWRFLVTDPGVGTGSGGSAGDLMLLDDESLWQSCCNQFWIIGEEAIFCSDDLCTIRFGFEPLDIKFTQPEIRTLEVGIMPLPLYDYDYNKIAPLIPHLQAFFSLQTDSCELLLDREPMKIGIRQGTYRSNPFVLQYQFDTRLVLKGSYQYKIDVCLPNGESRTSPYFGIQVA